MLWAAFIELSGWICPLTQIENKLLAVVGALLLAINLAAYGWLFRRTVTRRV